VHATPITRRDLRRRAGGTAEENELMSQTQGSSAEFHGPPETGDNISQPEVPLTANLTRPQACALGRPEFLTTARVASLSLLRDRQHGYHRFQADAEIRLFA